MAIHRVYEAIEITLPTLVFKVTKVALNCQVTFKNRPIDKIEHV